MSHAVNVGTTDRGWAYSRPADQAYLILHVGFAALPIIAGLDKFFDRLVSLTDLNHTRRRNSG